MEKDVEKAMKITTDSNVFMRLFVISTTKKEWTTALLYLYEKRQMKRESYILLCYNDKIAKNKLTENLMCRMKMGP